MEIQDFLETKKKKVIKLGGVSYVKKGNEDIDALEVSGYKIIMGQKQTPEYSKYLISLS